MLRKISKLIFIISFVQYTNCTNLTCKIANNPVALSFTDLGKIKRFLQALEWTEKLTEDITETELKVFKEIYTEDGINSEDLGLSINELLNKHGRKVEEHVVTTEDGYILTMHRIPSNGPAVFVVHGLFGSADDWVSVGPENALAYYLSEAGYDVWLANARGGRHSKKHKTKSPKCSDFWDFSFHEIGRYDLPAMIDYVLNKTGQSKLVYIGFSQGTTSFFVMGSELPEYNEKIHLMFSLSSVAWMSHLKSPIMRALSIVNGFLYVLGEHIGITSLINNDGLINTFVSRLCGNNVIAQLICDNVLNVFCGFDLGEMDVHSLPVVLDHFPGSCSTKQLVHYGQGIESGEFKQFDHGVTKNMKVYGSKQPPSYQVEKITAPVVMFYSHNDWFSNVTDVNILKEKLPNVIDFIEAENYGHVDYQFASTTKQKVYDKILKIMKEHKY